mmetsp:Transcript_38790/g.62149  ORF Transcript_38790/g.62149 Transcript_38790/m.62149 type:complete len:522 (+) Transcript_38790:1-1566(+)
MEDALGLVQQADAQGTSLYEHLTKLITALAAQQKPVDIAALSLQIKNATFALDIPKEIIPVGKDAKTKTILSVLNKIVSLYKIPPSAPLPPVKEVKEPPKDDDGNPIPSPLHYPLLPSDLPPPPQDLQRDGYMLSWAGVDMGDDYMAALSLSIRELSVKKDLSQVRLFGKINGTSKDYYILEAACPPALIESDKKRVAAEHKAALENKTPYAEMDHSESWGQGVNGFVYYVSNTAVAKAEDWVMLPRLNGAWIRTSRKSRRFFTGNLNARVGGYPSFPWGEAAYLRARIAEIAHECSLAPAGMWAKDDEVEGANVIKVSDGFEPKLASDLCGEAFGENWEHIMPALREGKEVKGVNNGGRVTKWTPPQLPEDAEPVEGWYTPDDDDEEYSEDIVRNLAEEKTKLPGFVNKEKEPLSPWTAALCTTMGYFPEKAEGAVAAIRSLHWPGALCASDGKSFVNIYVGTGQPRIAKYYSPPPPPKVLGEFQKPAGDDEGDAKPNPNGLVEQKDPRPPAPEGEAEGE